VKDKELYDAVHFVLCTTRCSLIKSIEWSVQCKMLPTVLAEEEMGDDHKDDEEEDDAMARRTLVLGYFFQCRTNLCGLSL
jgi:hypothetical protein